MVSAAGTNASGPDEHERLHNGKQTSASLEGLIGVQGRLITPTLALMPPSNWTSAERRPCTLRTTSANTYPYQQ